MISNFKNYLPINNSQKITIDFAEPLNSIVSCDEIPIYFENNNVIILLEKDFIAGSLRILINLLHKAINKELILHPSIIQDIGYMYNRDLHGDAGLEYMPSKSESHFFWVGSKYSLWQTPRNIKPNLTTWLYNDKQGNIILEITENYFWHFKDPEETDNFITYQEFMNNYKPYFITRISKEKAAEFIMQAEALLKQIEVNEKKFNE
jgi:hypothetical protein